MENKGLMEETTRIREGKTLENYEVIVLGAFPFVSIADWHLHVPALPP